MDKRNIRLIKKTVNEVLNQSNVELTKLILFGSYTHNEQREDSDVDLIVVSKSFRNDSYFKRVDKVLELNKTLVKKLKLPFDILLYSDYEWKNSSTIIIREAKQHGIEIIN